MHELSIAQEILDIIEKERTQRGFNVVSAIKLRTGALSGVDPAALSFSFEVIRQGTCAAQAQLDIEMETLKLYCSQCDAETIAEHGPAGCAHCGSVNVRYDATADIEILSLKVDLNE